MDTRQALRATARLYQRIGARIIVGLAFLGVLWCQIYFLLNSGFTARVFDELVNGQFRGRIAWRRLTYGPLPWRLKVLEPQLVGADGRPVIVAQAITIDQLALLDLAAGKIHAEAITVQSPRVRLVRRVHPTELDEWGQPEEVFNIEELFWPPERLADDGQPSAAPPLDFRRADIVDARCIIDMDPFYLRSVGVDIRDARFSLSGGVVRMRAERFSVARARVRVPFSGELAQPVVDAPRDAVLQWDVRDLSGHLYRWDDRWFGVARLDAQVDGGELGLRGFGMQLDTLDLPAVRGTVKLRTATVQRWLAQLGLGEQVRGAVALNVSADGELDALDAEVTVAGQGLTLFGVQVPDLTLAAHADALDDVILRALTANVLGGRVEASGEAQLSTGDAAVTLEAVGVEPTALPQALPEPLPALLAGKARIGVMARGTGLLGPQREASAAVRVDLARRRGPVFGLGSKVRLDAIGAWAGDQVTVHAVRADVGTAQAKARGAVDLAAEAATLRWSASAPDVAPFGRLADLAVRGRVRASGGLTGPWAAPVITASVRGRGLGWQALDFGAVDADARLALGTQRLTVRRLSVDGPLGKVAGGGEIGLAGRRPLKAKLTVRGVELGRLPLGGLPVGGRLDADLTAGGRLDAPTAAGTLRVLRPRYDRLTLRRLDVAGAWDGREVQLRDLALADDEGKRVTASGRFAPKSGRFDGRVGLLALDLALVNRFLETPIPLRGRVTATVGGAGTLTDPKGEGRVILEGIGFDTLDLGEGALTLSADGQMLMLRGPVFDVFEIDAAVPTAPGPAGRLTVAVDGLAIERFVPAMKAADARARVSGAVSAFLTDDWQLDHVRAQLGEVAAGLTLRDSAGRVVRAPEAPPCPEPDDPTCASVALASQAPVNLVYTHADETVRVESLALGGGGQSFEVTGEARLDRLALKVTGGLDLGGLFPFLRSAFTEVAGRADLALAVTGPPDNPDFAGRVRLDAAELIPRSPTVGSELSLLEPVTLTIQPPIGPVMPGPDGRLPRGRFVVDLPPQVEGQPNRFRVRRDDGEVEVTLVSGDFEDFQPQALRVGVATEEAEVDVPRTLTAALRTQDTTFELWVDKAGRRGPKTRLRLAGHVDILRGEYVADISPAAEITQGVSDNFRGRNRVRSVSVFERSKLLRNLEVDLSLRGQDEIFVRNKVTVLDLDLAVALDLRRVRGSLYPKGDTPLSIEGTVDVLDDSRITYARRPFDVTVGDVVFGAGSFVTADVVATHTFRLRTDRATQAGTFDRGASGDVREEEVTLTVRVVLDQLGADPEIDLNLSSSSGASKIEVATLVLTGAYPSDLTGAAGAAPATEVLLSPVLSLIEAPFEETLDVDLTLTPATTGTLFIDADKILSRRLRLYSRTPVGDEAASNLQTFGLEYRLNNEVTGELTNEQLGNLNSTSGRLRFRLLLD